MDLAQAGAELLNVLKQGLVSGSKVVAEQFPILCKQILQWGIVNNVCTILLSIFFMVFTYYLTRFSAKKFSIGWKENYDSAPGWIILSIVSGIVGGIFLIYFWCSIFELGKILSAPNVYLLDYFKGMVANK